MRARLGTALDRVRDHRDMQSGADWRQGGRGDMRAEDRRVYGGWYGSNIREVPGSQRLSKNVTACMYRWFGTAKAAHLQLQDPGHKAGVNSSRW